MKPSHILFTCCLLWLCQQQIAFSSECLGNDLDTDKCFDIKQYPSMAETEDSLNLIVRASFLFHSLEKSGQLDINNVKYLLEHIKKSPPAMFVLGIGISLVLLQEAVSDKYSVERIKEEYNRIHKTTPTKFVSTDDYWEFIYSRSSEIRNQIVALKTDLQYKGYTKTALAVGLAFVGFTTGSLPLKWGALSVAGGSGLAAIIEFHNCYELKELLTQLDRRGYIY